MLAIKFNRPSKIKLFGLLIILLLMIGAIVFYFCNNHGKRNATDQLVANTYTNQDSNNQEAEELKENADTTDPDNVTPESNEPLKESTLNKPSNNPTTKPSETPPNTSGNSAPDELHKIGYKVENLREAERRKNSDVSVETMEKSGWSLWFATLDARRGKCNSCQQLISTAGIQSHGHKCEYCGAVTYYDIIDGSEIRFSFVSESIDGSPVDITMIARRFDAEQGYLYLYPEVMDGLWLKGDHAKKYFEANKKSWEEVEEEGRRMIRVKYRNALYLEDSAINPSDIRGNYWNHKIVLVWEGKEYPEYSTGFPLPQSMSIYEAWHWAPLESSSTLHRRVLGAIHNSDDKGWHYQDGRPWFSDKSFFEMGKFIRHFTTLDADEWDRRSKNFRLDGPGGIDDVATFCHPDAQVENRPNIGNLIVGFGKALSGGDLTSEELAAMADAAKDPEIRNNFLW